MQSHSSEGRDAWAYPGVSSAWEFRPICADAPGMLRVAEGENLSLKKFLYVGCSCADTMTDQEQLLTVNDLRISFGGLVAVDKVSFELKPGEIVGLIGPNGAGKTTTFNLLTGFIDPDGGDIVFNGKDITHSAPHSRAQEGLIRTFQVARELSGMKVIDNLLLGAQDNPRESVVQNFVPVSSGDTFQESNQEKANQWLERLDLWELRDEYAGDLSGGQRKLLELGRALMADPDLLLLDEPMAGVNPSLTDRLLDQIRWLRDEQGLSFLIVEHDIDLIMSISDKIVAMHNGKVLSKGTPEKVQENDELLEAYLGADTV